MTTNFQTSLENLNKGCGNVVRFEKYGNQVVRKCGYIEILFHKKIKHLILCDVCQAKKSQLLEDWKMCENIINVFDKTDRAIEDEFRTDEGIRIARMMLRRSNFLKSNLFGSSSKGSGEGDKK